MNSAQPILVTRPIRRRLGGWLASQTLNPIEAAVVDRRFWLRSGFAPGYVQLRQGRQRWHFRHGGSRVEQAGEQGVMRPSERGPLGME